MTPKIFTEMIIIPIQKIFLASEIEGKNRFELLDGFRGILAISVVLQHNAQHRWSKSPGEYRIFLDVGSNFGVISFFLLSAFLLTYKLLANFNNSQSGFMNNFKIFSKYIIRRFFRIYIPYFILCCFLQSRLATSPSIIKYNPWINLITFYYLDGNHHLWTVIHEIKYYFIIPIFAFFTIKIQKFYIPLVISTIISIYLIKQSNVLKIDCRITSSIKFKNAFEIFVNGSLLAIVYYKLEKVFNKLKDMTLFKYFIDISSFLYFLYGLKLSSNSFFTNGKGFCGSNYGIYWNIFLALLLILDKETFFGSFINLPIFRVCGKFSFGMYLLHMEGFAIVHKIRDANIMSQSLLETYILELTISILYGMVFYYLIERPLLNIGNILISRINN